MWADSLVEPHVRILHTIDRSVVAGEGLVQVQAARQDGTPAAYAAVEIGLSIRRADMNGRALFPNIAFGSHEVCLLEPGLVFTTTRFQHLEGADTWVSVRERDGATLRVRAVDGTGGALPYALLDLVPTYPSGVAAGRRLPPVYWEDEDRTTQRLDGFTDEIGTRCFLHLDPMPTTIHARWGDLAGDTTVQLVEDRTTDVEIVLKEPE